MAELGFSAVRSVRAIRGVLLDPRFQRERVERIASEILADPVVDRVTLLAPGEAAPTRPGWHRIAIAPKAGVMDAPARTLGELLERTGLADPAAGLRVGTYQVFQIEASLPEADLQQIGRRLLANETIEDLCIDRDDLPFVLPAAGGRRERVEVPLLDLGDEGLLELSRTGQLSLTLEEMRCVQQHYATQGREPSAAELETVAQTWSEHCKHKTLTGIIEFTARDGSRERIDNLLKSTIAAATHEIDREDCLSVFVDNAGIVRFEGDQAVCIKVETHNHPSAIDPYGGAGTGIGGVIRDILGAGLGAKPIANLDAFFVGPPDLQESDVPRGTLHPRRVLRGVVAGVRDYGNRMGIPTVAGGLWMHPGYIANPLVYAGTVGLIPASMAQKEVAPGDRIVSLGGRTGRDGIHGATFSSIELSEHSETESSHAVQIGDPITEKGVLDVLLAARDRGLYRGVTDCGAGGYSSAVGEMGENCGARVQLDAVPLKYPGLASHEIWISEAQERMVLSVPPEHLAELLALCESEDVEAVDIGEFTATGRLELFDGEVCVGDVAMSFLHDGTPRPVRAAVAPPVSQQDPGCPRPADLPATILAAVGAPDNASRSWIVRQYDHEVQGGSVIKPLVGVDGEAPGNGAVIQPLPESSRGLSLTCGANPRQGLADAEAMALCSIDEALRNAVALGANPAQAVLLDNFSWGNCDRPEQLGALVLAAKACQVSALAHGAPFVSGKDSLNNEYRIDGEARSIPPTLLITALTPVPDARRAQTMDLKSPGSRVYLVGETRAELGASLHHALHGLPGGEVPRPDLAKAPALMRALHAAIAAGCTRAVHDLSEGGLAVAAAEMAFGGGLGLDLNLAHAVHEPFGEDYEEDATLLFSESATRFLVEVEVERQAAFEQHLAGQPAACIGQVVSDPRLRVLGSKGDTIAELSLGDLAAAHHGGFRS